MGFFDVAQSVEQSIADELVGVKVHVAASI
jgi:hypothetical protein